VPSKIFEYAKLGLPMLYFGGGEGEAIISEYQLGWIAKAGDYADLNTILASLERSSLNESLKENIKASATRHFHFDKQLDTLIKRL
ncbi:MAG: glycosyltransferase WbuB, partial [Gelidibacter sp.]